MGPGITNYVFHKERQEVCCAVDLECDQVYAATECDYDSMDADSSTEIDWSDYSESETKDITLLVHKHNMSLHCLVGQILKNIIIYQGKIHNNH